MSKARARSSETPRPAPPPTPQEGGWFNQRVGWWVVFGLGLAIAAAPAWLAADPLGGFRWNVGLTDFATQVASVADPLGCARLSPDDAAFVAASRTRSAWGRHLLDPADGQVVPIFRLLTFALVRASGDLAHLATLLALASYAALVGAMAAVGHVVAREDRRLEVALTAMAGIAASSVLEPATTSYAESRELWTAVVALAMLVMLQEWRTHGGTWRLAVALAMAAAAPLVGPGGFAAGPGGLAYLWADPRPFCRKAAALPVLASGLSVCLSFFTGTHSVAPFRVTVTIMSAVFRDLVLGNLGLDAVVTPGQGAVLVTAMAAGWAWSRSGGARTWPAPNPLEASGAALAVTALGSRPVGLAVAQVGAVLFAAGWWSALKGTHRAPAERLRLAPPTRGGTLTVLTVLVVLCVAQGPRFRRLGQSRVYRLSTAEARMFPIPTLQWWRTRYLAQELALRQARFLKRLDQAEARCRARGIGRRALRTTFGRVEGPGLSKRGDRAEAIDLLNLPESGPESDPAIIRSTVGGLLQVEPEPRPMWIPANDPWPPAEASR